MEGKRRIQSVNDITVQRRRAECTENMVKRCRVKQSFRRRKPGKDWLSWPKVRKGERECRFYRIWQWEYLAECACSCCFLRRRYPWELIHANMDIGWVIRVDQCSETIASAFHLPLCPAQHGLDGAYRKQVDLPLDYIHVCPPAAQRPGCLGNFAYKCILFTGIQCVLSHWFCHTRDSDSAGEPVVFFSQLPFC